MSRISRSYTIHVRYRKIHLKLWMLIFVAVVVMVKQVIGVEIHVTMVLWDRYILPTPVSRFTGTILKILIISQSVSGECKILRFSGTSKWFES